MKAAQQGRSWRRVGAETGSSDRAIAAWLGRAFARSRLSLPICSLLKTATAVYADDIVDYMSDEIVFTPEEAAFHEAGHFVIAHLLGVPLGDIKMVGNQLRRACISAEGVCDWIRELQGDESEARLRSAVRVLVAGEEGLIVHGTPKGKARVSGMGDIGTIRTLLEDAPDHITGKRPTEEQIQQWISESRSYVKSIFSQDAPAKALTALASVLKDRDYMSASDAHDIVAPIVSGSRE